MGNGLAHGADLELVTNDVLLYGPFIFALTYAWTGRSWKSSLMAPYIFLLYQVIVTFGAGIQDPLAGYVSQARFDANRCLNIVLTCMGVVGFSTGAWFWFRLLGSCEFFRIRNKIPNIVPPRAHKVLRDNGAGLWEIVDVLDMRVKPKTRFGLQKTQSWAYLFLTFLYVFGAICGSQVVYNQYLLPPHTGRELTSWLVRLLVPFGCGILLYLYDRARPDPATFGPNESMLTSNAYRMDEGFAAVMQRQTLDNVNWTVLPLVFFDLINVGWMGATRIWTPNITQNIYSLAGLMGLHLLLMLIVFFGARYQSSRNSKLMASTKSEAIDDSGNYYDDSLQAQQRPLGSVHPLYASTTPKTSESVNLGKALMGLKQHAT